MASDSHVQTRISEIHQYARHLFSQFVGWFTFFITINYASMGWLIGSDTDFTEKGKLLWLISSLFISQNVLGIFACAFFRHRMLKYKESLENYERARCASDSDVPQDLQAVATMPAYLYRLSFLLMIVALLTILVAWAFLPSLVISAAAT